MLSLTCVTELLELLELSRSIGFFFYLYAFYPFKGSFNTYFIISPLLNVLNKNKQMLFETLATFYYIVHTESKQSDSIRSVIKLKYAGNVLKYAGSCRPSGQSMIPHSPVQKS